MARNYRDSFFDSKRDWSNYKDSVLDYYLEPYLEKVKKIGKSICVVDMFAGRGELRTGVPGSRSSSQIDCKAFQIADFKSSCYVTKIIRHFITISLVSSRGFRLPKLCKRIVLTTLQGLPTLRRRTPRSYTSIHSQPRSCGSPNWV